MVTSVYRSVLNIFHEVCVLWRSTERAIGDMRLIFSSIFSTDFQCDIGTSVYHQN